MREGSGLFPENQSTGVFLKHILRKIFLEDWMMKLVALAITLGLWLGVTGLSTPRTERWTVPLTLRYSDNVDVTNSPIKEIDIVVTGDKRRVSQINKNDLSVSLDITDVPPGDRVISLTTDNVMLSEQLPTGVKLDKIEPNKIAVRIETVEEREIPVKAQTEGELPDGYEIYSETAVPQNVRVRGPSGFIRSLNFVSTEPIDLAGKTADFTARQIPVGVSNPKATVLEAVVDVFFRIGEKRVERQFTVPVKDEPFKRATVVIFGGQSLFENVSGSSMLVEPAKNEAGEDAPRILLPPGLDGRVEVRSIRIN